MCTLACAHDDCKKEGGLVSAASREAARQVIVIGRRDLLRMTPREQAIAAHCAGGPSVDELERRIIDYRRADGTLGDDLDTGT